MGTLVNYSTEFYQVQFMGMPPLFIKVMFELIVGIVVNLYSLLHKPIGFQYIKALKFNRKSSLHAIKR